MAVPERMNGLQSDHVKNFEVPIRCSGINEEKIISGRKGNEEFRNDEAFSSEIAVQTTFSSTYDGEFTFSCSWESPGNALIQCNIIDGWVLGVPEIPSESSGDLNDVGCPVYNASTVEVRPGDNESRLNVSSKSLEARKRGYPTTADMTPAQKKMGIGLSVESRKSVAVKSKSVQVQLPINPNCESLRLAGAIRNTLLHECSGFHGYSSITTGISWKLKSLCGIKEAVFDRYLFKLSQTTPWALENKTALLIFLAKLKLGLSFSTLGIFFGSDETKLSLMFNETLEKIYRNSENDIMWPSRFKHSALPTYFQGLYKESRVILICSEVEVEQPKDEHVQATLFSVSSNIYSYKLVIGMTPFGRVCFKSQPYDGRKSFKRALKDCGFLSKLNAKELVLTRCITPEMEFMVKKGVLLLAPQPNGSGGDDVEHDIGLHIIRCEKRLNFFKVLNKIPGAALSKINELVHICCCLINELPPLLTHDQRDEEL